MRITRISWANFKGLEDSEIKADGNDVTVRGQNGAGKSSIAEVVPFVLFGKVTGTIKRYANGLAPTEDGLAHGAEIEFDDGTTLRREIKWNSSGNKTFLYINESPAKSEAFKVEVEKLTHGGGVLVFNPFAFSDLKAEERRNLLLKMSGAIDDEEIFALPEFEGAKEIFDGLTASTFIARTKVDLKNPQAELSGIPHRIAELERRLASLPDDVDAKIFQTQLEDLRRERSKITADKSESEKISAELQATREQWTSLTLQKPSDVRREYEMTLERVEELRRQISRQTKTLDAAKARRETLLNEYHSVEESKPGTCPTCGQKIPLEQFKAKRDEKLLQIVTEGKRYKEEILSGEEALNELNGKLVEAQKKSEQLKSTAERQASAEQKRREQLATLEERIGDLKRQLETARATEENNLRVRLDEADKKISDVNQRLSEIKAATETKTRIKELRTRQKELNRQITELEGHLRLADSFQQRKIELVEEKISANFEHVRFKLFDYLIGTGELKPKCEAMLNGVPYSALSKGERLKAALDIFKAVQKFYRTEMPLLIDDAESYTANSFVDLPNQLWLFKVSDEPKLVITVQKKESVVA